MLQPITLLPGVTLRCYTDHRFKQGCLSLQLVRPMKKEEAALNALLPAVLLRGCEGCADMRQITLRLDDLYAGEVDKIDELDEEILLFRGDGCNHINFKQLPALKEWKWIVSPNVL